MAPRAARRRRHLRSLPRTLLVRVLDGEPDRADETFASKVEVNGAVHLFRAEFEQAHAKSLPARLEDRRPPSLGPIDLDFVAAVNRLGLPLYNELASCRRQC